MSTNIKTIVVKSQQNISKKKSFVIYLDFFWGMILDGG